MNILERFHLALAYLEKSERELDKWMRVRESRSVDLSQFDLVKDRYERHVKQAQELVDLIRTSQRESLEPLKEEIHQRRRAQQKLIEAIAAGTVKPKQANKQNRAIADDLDRLEDACDSARIITEATSTEALGGNIDLPFSDYTRLLELDESEQSSKRDRTQMSVNPRNVLVLIVIGLLGWWGWSYYQTLGHLSFTISLEDNQRIIRTVCENTGNRNVRIVIPWENGIPSDGSPPSRHGSLFGVLVYVKEDNKPEFQILPETPEMWEVGGNEHRSGASISLRPGERVYFTLNTLDVRKSGVDLDEIRLDYTRYGGRVVKRFQTSIR